MSGDLGNCKINEHIVDTDWIGIVQADKSIVIIRKSQILSLRIYAQMFPMSYKDYKIYMRIYHSNKMDNGSQTNNYHLKTIQISRTKDISDICVKLTKRILNQLYITTDKPLYIEY